LFAVDSTESWPPLKFLPASKCGVKAISRVSSALPCTAIAASCVLFVSLASAQTPKRTSTSEMISPKSEANVDGAIEPGKPSITEDSADNSVTIDPATLLPDLPPVPKANATLVGGMVDRIDRVRDKITVRVFGGGKESFLFDPRTQVYRGGEAVTVADLRVGERIYLDTILDGDDVFARTIRLRAASATGTSQGVVLKFQNDRGELSVRDALSPDPVEVSVNSLTKITEGRKAVSPAALVPGALISMRFGSGQAARITATEISILAQPGAEYTFSGQVAEIDLRTRLIVLSSSIDHTTYELYLPPSMVPDENLHPGVTVTAVTNYDGGRYVVRGISITSP